MRSEATAVTQVSTTGGSGWASQSSQTEQAFPTNVEQFAHLLPQVVLTCLSVSWLLPILPAPIKMNLDLFQRRQAFFDLFINYCQKTFQLVARVHDLDDDWQVLR